MLFNSLSFILLFLPVSWLGYQVTARAGHQIAMGWLLAMSLLFYAWWNPAYLALLCGSAIFNFSAGELILRQAHNDKAQERLLTAGILANVLLLCGYKYLFPVLHWLEQFGFHTVDPAANVLLPLGISFFTFTQIGYLIDCKAGITSGGRFIEYFLFVTFFPHLIAGPILHHREMMPQLKAPAKRHLNWENLALGCSIFFIGLAKKDFIADWFAISANEGFSHAGGLSMRSAWTSVLSYSMQLYFDFSGYSEMAAGLALLFNIRFPANFDSPYKSPSIIDFWQRWHMTLTRYLNLYLYNPIALWTASWRARQGLPVGRSGLKTASGFAVLVVVPTLITMLLAGVWHGAGLNFVMFGLLHAAYLCINHMWRLLFHKKKSPSQPAWYNTVWKVGLTFLAVLIAEVFFRASSFQEALAMLSDMMGRHVGEPTAVVQGTKPLLLAFGIIWFAPNVLQVFSAWNPMLTKPHTAVSEWMQWKPSLPWAVALGLLAALALLAISGQTEFLYFQF